MILTIEAAEKQGGYDWGIASKSEKKLNPFEHFLGYRGWQDQVAVGCAASSAGPEQPRLGGSKRNFQSAAQMSRCCLTRLLHSMVLLPHARKGWIAQENGVITLVDNDADDRDWLDATHDIDLCVTYMQTVDGRRTLNLSQGLEMPQGAMTASAQTDFAITGGKFIAEMLGTPEEPVDHADWFGRVTRSAAGVVELTRPGALFDALRVLFAQHERKIIDEPLIDAFKAKRGL